MVNINTEMSANIDDTMVLLFYDRYIFLVFYKFMIARGLKITKKGIQAYQHLVRKSWIMSEISIFLGFL